MKHLPSLAGLSALTLLGLLAFGIGGQAVATPNSDALECGEYSSVSFVPTASVTAFSRISKADAYAKAQHKFDAALLAEARSNGLALPDCPTIECIQQPDWDGCEQDVRVDWLTNGNIDVDEETHEPDTPDGVVVYECSITHAGDRRGYLGCDMCIATTSQEL